MVPFAIPASATALTEVPDSQLDLRSDEELLAQLRDFKNVTSEKNVWAFWDKGIDLMYPSYRTTVLNWIRKLGPSWTVRIVDLVEGSPNHVYNYVSREWFPECFINQTMDGKSKAQHASDLVRLPLLYEYGGVWMDVGNMLHTHLDDLFWNAFSAPDSQYEMGVWIISGQIRKQWGSFGNYMLASRKGCTFIKNWHNGYKSLWKGRTNCDGFHTLPLVQEIGLAEGMADWNFQDKIKEMSDYVAHMLIGDRTRHLHDVETGWNGREFFNNKCLMVEGIYNGVLGAIRTEFHGQKQVDLFLTSLNEQDQQKKKAAEDFIVYHNSAGGLPALGDMVKKKEYLDADHRPGTYGELYRYGTVHWRPTRKVEYLKPEATDEKLIHATPTAPAQDFVA
ncbi:hypothetical protein M409DRAFT_70910 [Zasmidium cellare ATCC 36951]|uniref:Glycosyltransferase family 32 protein n=1 Tax=Zasmidium cellare ATCC 36951 TaxID=1080233 RepID=A0A6A6BY09_ZASCE|nr:uncharacterized protein M409DRAFT_70910 [Zasmidium cellare ATCC 36951]KAF2159595.1 hypothetical protein M409DRAFT_70910 [Zasmidium cellare ATCC 36951]